MPTDPGTERELRRRTEDTSGDADRISARRRRLPRVGCWVVIAVIVLLSAAFWFGPVRWAREAAIASVSMCPLNQLQLAMHNYHDTYDCFPPAYVADESGKPMHSWRVLILPFVEKRELYEEYDFSEPWDSPNNRKLADRMPHIFHCRSEPESSTYTNMVVIRGPRTAFPDGESTSVEGFRDGLGETILIAEIAKSSICWLEPRDLDVRQMSFSINDETKPSISSSRRKGPYVVFADSIRCRRLSESLAPEALRALTTIAGQEPMYVAEIDNVGLISPAAGPATDAALGRWEDWKGLRTLWLSRSAVTDAAVAELSEAADLATVYLQGTRITDDGLKHFLGRANLDKLDLSATGVTDAGLDHLTGLGGVHVYLKDTRVTTGGVVRLLKSLPEASIRFFLGYLSRDYLDFKGSSATDVDVLLCQGLTKLSSVDLSRTQVTDASLEVLGGMTELRSLRLDHTQITDAGCEHLAGLKELSTLHLGHTQITDTGIEHLRELHELWGLDLSGTSVTDDGIKHLGALPRLARLKLNGTQVSDVGLQHLGPRTNLRLLELRRTAASNEVFRRIEKASPNVRIVR